MVTDYASVAFDFARLGKPVVYTQFDRGIFVQNHISEPGYFDHERDGFGQSRTRSSGGRDDRRGNQRWVPGRRDVSRPGRRCLLPRAGLRQRARIQGDSGRVGKCRRLWPPTGRRAGSPATGSCSASQLAPLSRRGRGSVPVRLLERAGQRGGELDAIAVDGDHADELRHRVVLGLQEDRLDVGDRLLDRQDEHVPEQHGAARLSPERELRANCGSWLMRAVT